MNDQATVNVQELIAARDAFRADREAFRDERDALRVERDALIAENEAMKATDAVVRENHELRQQIRALKGALPGAIEVLETRPALVAASLEALVASTIVLTICRTREFKNQDGRGYGGDAQPTEQLERLAKAIEQLREALG